MFKSFDHRIRLNNSQVLIFVICFLSLGFGAFTHIASQALFFDADTTPYNLLTGKWKVLQFLVSYQDFGFVKRGLIGSFSDLIFPFFGAYSANAVSILMIVMLWICISLFISNSLTDRLDSKTTAIFLVAASPSLMHYGYDMGRYDQINFILLVLSLFIIKRNKYILCCCVHIIASLNHEAYIILYYPFFVLFVFLEFGGSARNKAIITTSLCVVASTLTVATFGRIEDTVGLCQKAVEVYGSCAVKAANVWPRTLEDNLFFALAKYSHFSYRSLIELMLSAVYFIFSIIISVRLSGVAGSRRILMWAVAVAPLTLSIVAIDVYRWVAISILNMFVICAYLAEHKSKKNQFEFSDGYVKCLGGFTLLGPMGVGTSFPLVFVVIKVLGLN